MDSQLVAMLNILNDPKYTLLFLALTIWSLAWKGVALWKSAKQSQKGWFVALLMLNTFGILEMVYLFYFSKSKIIKETSREK